MRKLLFVIIVMFVFCKIAIAQPGPEQTWGLCIGIAEYAPDNLSLNWADKDAIEFSTFLKYGLRLPEDHYRVVKNNG